MNFKKVLYLVVICLLSSIFMVSCKDFQEDIGKTKFPMTIEEVKDYYGTEFVSYTSIDENQVFVKYKSEFGNAYRIVNFKDKRIYNIPVMIETLIFKELINENEIIFEAFGGNHINAYERFPFLIHASKTEGEDYKLEEDMIWSDLNEEIKTSVGKKGEVENIIISPEGLEIIFYPYEGEEADFYAAYVDIPPTTVEVMDSHNMIITFKGSRISKNMDLNYLEHIEHKYIREIYLKEDKDYISIFITLTNETKEYGVTKNKLHEEIPFIEVRFR